jgi:hypothetical protein
LSENTFYAYRLRATGAAGASAYTDASSAYTQPKAPSNLAAIFVSAGQINLSWTNNSAPSLYSSVEQSADGSSWTQIDYAPGASTYSATGPFNPSATYYFRVNALASGGGHSGYTNVVAVTTPAYPIAPSNLTAAAVSDSQINLTWTDNSNNESGFTIQRSTDSVSWTPLATTAANATSYSDVGLNDGTYYYYRVAATNAAGNSSFTDSASAQTAFTVPTVATAASASPSVLTGTTTALSVLGAFPGGQESNLTYYWSVVSGPDATFSTNYANAAKNTTATFSAVGSYTFRATIQNGGASVSSDVSVTVQQTLTTIAVTPSGSVVLPGGTEQFTAAAYDQFGALMNPTPTYSWSVTSGGGTIDGSGLYTAPSSVGTGTVQATSGSVSGQAQISANVGLYRVTINGRQEDPGYSEADTTGNLTVTNLGWITAASPQDAVAKAVSGTVSVSRYQPATLVFPRDLNNTQGFGFGFDQFIQGQTAGQYTGRIGMWDGDPGAPEDWDYYWNVTVQQAQLNTVTATDAAAAVNTVTAATTTPEDLWLGADNSGQAHFYLSSGAGGVTPDTSDARAHALWTLSGDNGAPISGNLVGTTLIDLTPNASHEYAVDAGIDANGDGILQAAEVTQVIDVHVLSVASIVLSTGGQQKTSTDDSAAITDANVFAVPDGPETLTVQADGTLPNTADGRNHLRWAILRNQDDAIKTAPPQITQDPENLASATIPASGQGSYNVVVYVDKNQNGTYDAGEELRILHLAIVFVKVTTVTPTLSNNFFATVSGNDVTVTTGTAANGGEDAFSLTSHLIILGGGADQTIGVSKVHVGLVQNLTGDTDQVGYGNGAHKETTVFKDGSALLQLPLLDASVLIAGSGGVTGFSNDARENNRSPAAGGGYGEDITFGDAHNMLFDAQHDFGGTIGTLQAATTGGATSFTDYISAYSSDFDQTYAAYAMLGWTEALVFNLANGTWVNNGSSITKTDVTTFNHGQSSGVTTAQLPDGNVATPNEAQQRVYQ